MVQYKDKYIFSVWKNVYNISLDIFYILKTVCVFVFRNGKVTMWLAFIRQSTGISTTIYCGERNSGKYVFRYCIFSYHVLYSTIVHFRIVYFVLYCSFQEILKYLRDMCEQSDQCLGKLCFYAIFTQQA